MTWWRSDCCKCIIHQSDTSPAPIVVTKIINLCSVHQSVKVGDVVIMDQRCRDVRNEITSHKGRLTDEEQIAFGALAKKRKAET